jgi:hypothetical protein
MGRGALAIIVTVLMSAAPRAQEDTAARMQRWATSLGVQCAYCHVDGAWTDTSKPAFDFARRMSHMVSGLNAGPSKTGEPITCWTCHRGQARPARLPIAAWQKIQAEHVGDFTTPERSLAMSVYSASLGVECTHCHELGAFSAPTKPGYAMVETMLPIFDEIQKHFADSPRKPVTQCYMCHQGQRVPERRPR